jgi:hypothetical protein
MRAATDLADPSGGLLALSRDLAVTQVLARNRRDAGGRDVVTVEVTRNGTVAREPLIREPGEFDRLVSDLLGPGRACGCVTVHGLHGFAAMPPAADASLLVLERLALLKAAPDHGGAVPADIVAAAAAVLGAGAGIVLGGPHGSHIGATIRAIVARLGPSAKPVVIGDGPPIPVRRDAIRLREAPYEALRILRHSIIVYHRTAPPTLTALAGAVLIVATARTPEGALARLICGTSGRPAILARLCAETAPLFLWFEPGPQKVGLTAVYEILPQPAAGFTGLPALQMLTGADPETGTFVPTGAVPVDAAVRAAFHQS